MGRTCSAHGKEEKRIPNLVRKPVRKRSLARPRQRQQDYIKMNFKQVGWEGVGWINVA
jgi:hypothetical protein